MIENRKVFTAAVERGIKYAIAQLEFDAKSGPVTLSDGAEIPVGITATELTAAAEWLRYVVSRKA